MRTKVAFAVALVALGFVVKPVIAHHSFVSEFNPNQIRTIHGTITDVSWGNPHVSLKITTKDGLGPATVWRVNGDSPTTLMSKGAIRLRHPMGIFLFLYCRATIIRCIHDFSRQLFFHRLFPPITR